MDGRGSVDLFVWKASLMLVLFVYDMSSAFQQGPAHLFILSGMLFYNINSENELCRRFITMRLKRHEDYSRG